MQFPGRAPVAGLELGFAGLGDDQQPHLSVDGMTPNGPNLSHWPGNRTPPQWRADLSTGIALRFARATETEQQAFLGEARLVLNDHFDTDGFGALLTVLRPEVAIAREELLLAAAAAGDFGTFGTWRGFAIDRIVNRIAHPASPVRGAFAGIEDAASLSLQRYRWLIEHAESVLDHPGGYRVLYEEELRQVQAEIDQGLRGRITRSALGDLGLSMLTSDGPRHRMVLNSLAGAFRVLHVDRRADGVRYRYHDRTESWFDLVTFRAPPRRDLRPIAAQLGRLEAAHDGASWNADPPTEPIPELYFGVAAPQEYGQITRELRPSRLKPEQVQQVVAHGLATAAAACS